MKIWLIFFRLEQKCAGVPPPPPPPPHTHTHTHTTFRTGGSASRHFATPNQTPMRPRLPSLSLHIQHGHPKQNAISHPAPDPYIVQGNLFIETNTSSLLLPQFLNIWSIASWNELYEGAYIARRSSVTKHQHTRGAIYHLIKRISDSDNSEVAHRCVPWV